MAKSRSKYTCQQCGYVSPKYLGRCPQCDQWQTFVESVDATSSSATRSKSTRVETETEPLPLSDVVHQHTQRMNTSISELDHVLGGGIVPGQVILLAGEPGVGKSTLLLQVAQSLISSQKKRSPSEQPRTTSILYASGEESPEQISLRAKRLKFSPTQMKSLALYAQTHVEAIVQQIASKPPLVIVDSIQTLWSDTLTGAPGSVGQVRECSYQLVQAAKQHHVPVIIVGQVTKEGTVAGPKTLEHLVDTVLSMEGSRFEDTRLLRVDKNRFGPTDEVGVFEMKETGLHAVSNPSRSFISNRDASVPGQAIAVILEGTRPLLVEVQALASYSDLKTPRRVGNGIPVNRLTMICAILTKHLKLSLDRYDVYVNVSGGLSIAEPAGDLAVALAIWSSFTNKPLPDKGVVIGEVSLLGEIQEVSRMDKRAKEAKRMGHTHMLSVKQASTLQKLVSTMK